MRLSRNIVFAILLALASGAGAAEVTRARYLMGTVCEIRGGSEAQIGAAFDEAARNEGLLSTWQNGSELSRLNRGELAEISPELEALLLQAAFWSRETAGAFSPLVRPLLDAWRTREEGALPTDAELAAAVRRADPSNLLFAETSPRVRLQNGAAVEEGGFGKGYAIDRMLAILEGPAVVNFGGQLGVRGATRVTIADPEQRSHPVLAFTLTGGSLSTSSGSEKAFTVQGRRFCHIVDPRTGQALPPRGSVSVVHPSALVADILSTALYVMGPSDGLAWARTHGVAAIFIDPARVIRLSSPLPDLTVLDTHFTIEGKQTR